MPAEKPAVKEAPQTAADSQEEENKPAWKRWLDYIVGDFSLALLITLFTGHMDEIWYEIFGAGRPNHYETVEYEVQYLLRLFFIFLIIEIAIAVALKILSHFTKTTARVRIGKHDKRVGGKEV